MKVRFRETLLYYFPLVSGRRREPEKRDDVQGAVVTPQTLNELKYSGVQAEKNHKPNLNGSSLMGFHGHRNAGAETQGGGVRSSRPKASMK